MSEKWGGDGVSEAPWCWSMWFIYRCYQVTTRGETQMKLARLTKALRCWKCMTQKEKKELGGVQLWAGFSRRFILWWSEYINTLKIHQNGWIIYNNIITILILIIILTILRTYPEHWLSLVLDTLTFKWRRFSWRFHSIQSDDALQKCVMVPLTVIVSKRTWFKRINILQK